MRQSGAMKGFTLVEMAVVLLILGLLMAGLLQPLANRMEQSRRQETLALLDDARDALLGFALVNGRLPCPDVNGDGLEDTAGCQTLGSTYNAGVLPWSTLGVASSDAWGRSLTYMVNGAFVTTFDLASSGSGAGVLGIYDGSGCSGGTLAVNVPALVISGAKEDYGSALEQENRDGDACLVSRDYSTVAGSEFDDLVTWLAPTILFNRMVEGGRLP